VDRPQGETEWGSTSYALGPKTGADAPEYGDTVIPRRIHRAILAVLRPAESAARRLVIVAARDLVLPPLRLRKPGPKPASIFVRPGEMRTGIVLPYGVKPGDILPNLARQRARTLSLPLTDTLRGLPRRSTDGAAPRIWAPGFDDPYRPRKSSLPDYLVGATRLAMRLQALGRVLDDLPRHARRFARWRARVTAQSRQRPRRIDPLRPGRPPGGRRKPAHEVHEVLADLQYFAFHALAHNAQLRRDSS
jgi:hypothetical protein